MALTHGSLLQVYNPEGNINKVGQLKSYNPKFYIRASDSQIT